MTWLPGLIAAILQALIFLIVLAKMVYPSPEIVSILSLSFFLLITGVCSYSFFRLRTSPELVYFAMASGVGFLMMITGILLFFPFGMFMLPGALAILTGAGIYLLASETLVSFLRKLSVIAISVSYLLMILIMLIEIVYLLNMQVLVG